MLARGVGAGIGFVVGAFCIADVTGMTGFAPFIAAGAGMGERSAGEDVGRPAMPLLLEAPDATGATVVLVVLVGIALLTMPSRGTGVAMGEAMIAAATTLPRVVVVAGAGAGAGIVRIDTAIGGTDAAIVGSIAAVRAVGWEISGGAVMREFPPRRNQTGPRTAAATTTNRRIAAIHRGRRRGTGTGGTVRITMAGSGRGTDGAG